MTLPPGVRNALLVARREYLVRVRSRAFLFSTVLLAVVAVVMGVTPFVVRLLEREGVVRIAVETPDVRLDRLAVSSLDLVLNGPTRLDPTSRPPYEITVTDDPDGARARVVRGELDGLLLVSRGASDTLSFTYVTRNPEGRQAILMQLAAVAIGASARADEARGLIGGFDVVKADPAAETPPREGTTASRTILATLLIVLVFITSVTYGMWVAASVVEEKTSRVMEVMLSAASPGEMLAGKVVGVGSAGLTQYLAIVVPAAAMLVLQGRIAAAILGSDGVDPDLLGGMTPELLGAFLVLFVLGFLFSALLYAAAASLVSRQEDVQQVALPMLLLSMAGYFGAAIATTSIEAWWVAPLSFVPFFSPYLMLARLALGDVAPWELLLAITILVFSIAIALWVAARVYAAGVLLYGERPTARRILTAVRYRR